MVYMNDMSRTDCLTNTRGLLANSIFLSFLIGHNKDKSLVLYFYRHSHTILQHI